MGRKGFDFTFTKMVTIVLAVVGVLLIVAPAEARITKIVIDRQETTFEGTSFGDVGQYEKIVGRAFGEVDPNHPLNAIIQDINLAPRNSRGMVEYETPFYMLKPVDMSKGNGFLFYDVVNRGGKVALSQINRGTPQIMDPSTAAHAGDGLLMRRGYTILWSGWQGDVLLNNPYRLIIKVPVATNGGATITGLIRSDLQVTAPTSTLPLSSGSFTQLNHTSYETVSLDNSTATLTKRVREKDLRVEVPRTDWAFADCSTVAFPGVPSTTKICLKGGFSTNYIYELLYTAKNPLVLGLGFAATRDVVSFFRHASQDDAGTPNPLAGLIHNTIAYGLSQSGCFLRTFVQLGFNEDEAGRIVFEGMNPHVAARAHPLNVRFGHPGRAYGQHEDHLYAGFEAPLTWLPTYDPIADRSGYLLQRCRMSDTCPKIIHTLSSTEYWQSRMSLNTTDDLGLYDTGLGVFGIPYDELRIYLYSSTQHTPAATPSYGYCKQLSNPSPYNDSARALIVALARWVSEGVEPPPSRIPTIREQTLVSPDKASIEWPDIPGVKYTGLVNDLTLLDFGTQFDYMNESGVITEPTLEVTGRDYKILVPKVDADGNEIAGIRSTTVQAPLGTYTGWNLRKAGFAEDELCQLQGSYIPFYRTKSEREAAGDPRLSLEERYGTHAGYVAAVRAAAADLQAQGFLLAEDADRLIDLAEDSDVLK